MVWWFGRSIFVGSAQELVPWSSRASPGAPRRPQGTPRGCQKEQSVPRGCPEGVRRSVWILARQHGMVVWKVDFVGSAQELVPWSSRASPGAPSPGFNTRNAPLSPPATNILVSIVDIAGLRRCPKQAVWSSGMIPASGAGGRRFDTGWWYYSLQLMVCVAVCWERYFG